MAYGQRTPREEQLTAAVQTASHVWNFNAVAHVLTVKGQSVTARNVTAMKCAYCGKSIAPKKAWKGSHGFYCSEFCADVETEEAPGVRAARKSHLARVAP
jgi:hypothetical protein